VKVSKPRVRPRGTVELHAYLTEEAIDFELEPSDVPVRDTTVLVPNSFTFLLMKLHAFRDRMNDEDEDDDSRQLGRHHALDVYRLVAMLTETEETFVRERRRRHAELGPVKTAIEIVTRHLADESSIGTLRLREHRLAGDHLDVPRFLEELRVLFAPS
jgi:hypothetical protein